MRLNYPQPYPRTPNGKGSVCVCVCVCVCVLNLGLIETQSPVSRFFWVIPIIYQKMGPINGLENCALPWKGFRPPKSDH